MKALKLSRDVVTLAEFKSQAATLLERIQEQESSRFMASVNRGLQDADNGKLLTATQVKSRLGLKK